MLIGDFISEEEEKVVTNKICCAKTNEKFTYHLYFQK